MTLFLRIKKDLVLRRFLFFFEEFSMNFQPMERRWIIQAENVYIMMWMCNLLGSRVRGQGQYPLTRTDTQDGFRSTDFILERSSKIGQSTSECCVNFIDKTKSCKLTLKIYHFFCIVHNITSGKTFKFCFLNYIEFKRHKTLDEYIARTETDNKYIFVLFCWF